MVRPRVGTQTLLLLGVGLAIALSGCATTAPHHHSTHPSPTPSISPRATPTASPRTTPTATATVSVAPVCQAASIAAGMGPSNNAAGHQASTVVLTNDSSAACSLKGFPTLQLLNAGVNLTTNQTDGISPAGAPENLTPTLVTIAPDSAASFVVQWLDVPTGAQQCAVAWELGIHLPGGGGAVTAAVDGIMPCGGDLYVAPIRAGTAAP